MLMIPEELPAEVCEQVTEYFASCVERETGDGRKTFLYLALDRKDFLPKDLRKQVNSYRGNVHMREFLLNQPGFINRLGRYI
jgi:hypothetical protein